MKFKLKPIEKKWILYDIGNSAFALLISTIIPIYFNYLAGDAGISEVNYLAYWGYATSAATVIVAVLGPLLGTVSDVAGRKKKIFMIALLAGAFGCVFLGFMQSWIWIYAVLDLVFVVVCICKISVFFKSCDLRFDAYRYYIGRTDG